jgi:hypothetical protein
MVFYDIAGAAPAFMVFHTVIRSSPLADLTPNPSPRRREEPD